MGLMLGDHAAQKRTNPGSFAAGATAMYNMYIVKRTQIYLEAGQWQELAARAKRQGTTSSHLIREAVDEYIAQPGSADARRLAQFRAALDETFGAVPRLPSGEDYVAELRRGEADRWRRVTERRDG
jgi:hypothetical protein